MKRTAILLLLVVLSMFSFSQRNSKLVNISYGEDFKGKKRSFFEKAPTVTDNGITLSLFKFKYFGKNRYYLMHFDENMKYEIKKNVNLKFKNHKCKYETITNLGGKLIVLRSYVDRPNKKKVLVAQEFDESTLLPIGEGIEVTKIDYKGTVGSNSGKFDFKNSPDNSKLLVINSPPVLPLVPEKYTVTVLDKSLKVQWSENLNPVGKNEFFDIESFVVDNTGNVHLSASIRKDETKVGKAFGIQYNSEKTSVLGKPKEFYNVYGFYEDGKKTEKYKIKIENRSIISLFLKVDQNQNVICAGFFSKPKNTEIEGYIFSRIDIKEKFLNEINYDDFESGFIRGNALDNTVYFIHDVLINDKNESVLIAESISYSIYNTTTFKSDGSSNTSTHVSTLYGEIITVRFSQNDEFMTSEKIRKVQMFTPLNSSVLIGQNDNDLYFIYNTCEKLYSRDFDLNIVKVDESGKQVKEELGSQNKFNFIPTYSKQISPNGFLAICQKGAKKRLMKYTIK